ncbi:fimbria/pilus outer membrane usher protein [Rahnella victoriana]|uniref:fimbria/pilus outer membrane usher protein n=1 Tax=Rahnella victoriana TaxID=1510570 RepID=UPI001E59971A|nr:fimbria/pilus outer membrane usher protein [Rahnella victoriana]UHM93632.1 fimbrial biogenesis outer membrane usher protein [Rahnella victoriana]
MMNYSKIYNSTLMHRISIRTVIVFFLAIFPAWATETVGENIPADESESIEFETDALRQDDSRQIDVKRFATGASAMPGVYRVNVFVNNTQIAYEDVEIKEKDTRGVFACLTPKLIGLISFNESQLPADVKDALSAPLPCTDLKSLLPEAAVEFDSNEQQLNITLPQIYVNRSSSGSVSPELWDSGITAATLGYYLNGYDSQYGSDTSRSFYAGLNGGLNIGAWYLRHNGSYSWAEDMGGEYSAINTYLQRDVAAVRGRVILGQANTSGQIFNSLPYTGAQLISDDSMLPDSQRGYAPEIRGIAKTNAKVTVKQQGQVIYETTVTPGAFLINDLYPTGYGGDLEVTIQEADGTTQSYTMPYASVAQLLRPGTHFFSLTGGRLRDASISDDPLLVEGTYQRGLSNSITAYGGAQVSSDYQAVQVGAAVGTEVGAIAADVTQSYSKLGGKTGDNSSLSGQSYKASYSKLIRDTDSNFTLAAYRFSSSGYMDYMTTMLTRESIKNGDDIGQIGRSKNRFAVTASQGLPDGWGGFYVSASMENYWNNDKYNKQYQLGYSNGYKRLSYSVNVNRTQSANGTEQTRFNLNFSFPLWENRSLRAPTVSVRYNEDSLGGRGQQASVAGALGENNKYTYNVNGAHDNRSGSSGGIAGTWQGSASSVNGSYSTGADYRSTSLGMSGTLVAHSGGVTLSPFNGDTFALIEAKGAEGAKVGSYAGAVIDSRGYALFPSLRPYQFNEVSIDPAGADKGVDFENTSQKVVPRSGAVVKVKINTRIGIPILITSLFNGDPVPFGAEVFDMLNNYVGAVSQGGMIYAKVNDMKGTLLVKWGSTPDSRCKVSYMLAPLPKDKALRKIPQRFDSPCERSP